MTEAEIDHAIGRMELLGRDASGWLALYRGPGSNVLWELFYPHGEMHGGGPRVLRPISSAEANDRYPFVLSEVEGRAADDALGARASTTLSTNGT